MWPHARVGQHIKDPPEPSNPGHAKLPHTSRAFACAVYSAEKALSYMPPLSLLSPYGNFKTQFIYPLLQEAFLTPWSVKCPSSVLQRPQSLATNVIYSPVGSPYLTQLLKGQAHVWLPATTSEPNGEPGTQTPNKCLLDKGPIECHHQGLLRKSIWSQ